MVTDFAHVKGTVVSAFSNFPPDSCSTTKLWIDALSATAKTYFPGFSVVTFLPFEVRVIVKPGPTVPVSFGGAAAGRANAIAAVARASATTASPPSNLRFMAQPLSVGEAERTGLRPARRIGLNPARRD